MGRQFIDFWMFYQNIHTESPVSSRCLNFFVDIVGRIKCPAYIGCGDTPTRNTNLVNLTTDLENVNLFSVVVVLFCFLLCVCTRTFHGLLKGISISTLNYFSFENTLLFLCVCVFP